MSVFALDDDHKFLWDDFVRAHPEGSFFHLSGWKDVLERGFGFQTHYMYAKKDGKIIGVLPLAYVKRPVFGAALISTPLCVYGGGIGDCAEIEAEAIRKAEALKVQYLELRNRDLSDNERSKSARFFTFRGVLSKNHEENLKAIPRKQRAEIRKGLKANLDTTIDQDIERFYKIYALSVRNLGTPVFAQKYLRVLLDVFGDVCEVTTISHAGTDLSSVLSFCYKDQILPYYGGGTLQARAYSAYPTMYWKVMEHSVNTGARIFDFGRSMEGSGAYAFKKNFGFVPEPLHYEYHLVRVSQAPNMDPDSSRNKMITDLWRKMPLSLANRLGPFLYPVIV